MCLDVRTEPPFVEEVNGELLEEQTAQDSPEARLCQTFYRKLSEIVAEKRKFKHPRENSCAGVDSFFFYRIDVYIKHPILPIDSKCV